MSDINVSHHTQQLIVDMASNSVSVVNAGPQGPAGPPGTGGGGSSSTTGIDGGAPSSTYGGTVSIDGGTP